MLIKGLGRVEGTVEDLQPVTLKQLIPLDLLDSFIGIYWHVGKGKFIIYKAPLLDAKYAVVEMGQDYDEQSNTDDLQIDYNVFHMDIWDEDVLKKYGRLQVQIEQDLSSNYISGIHLIKKSVEQFIRSVVA